MFIEKKPDRLRAASLVINDKGELLIIKVKGREIWTSLGGGIEEGETPDQTVIREIKEEVGLHATSATYYTETPIEPAAGDPTKTVKMLFYLVKAEGEIMLDPKEVIEAVKWISRKDFDEIIKGNSIKIGSGLEQYAIPKLIDEGILK